MSAAAPYSGQNNLTVSVIIPAYNYAHFLPQAIESAVNQTLPPLEILVIDDGSTDDTARVVAERFGRHPLVRYIHQTNAGLSAARNTGIQNARGEFVALLDADDLWQPEFLQEVLARFSRLPAEFAVVAAHSSFIAMDGSPLPTSKHAFADDMEFTSADIILKTRFSPSSAVVRRAAFAESGLFDTTLRSSEDRDMWARLSARHRILRCGRHLVQIRRHGQNMSTHTDRMKTNTSRMLAKARNNPQISRLPRWLWLQAYSFLHFQTAWMYFEEGRRAAALRDLFTSWFQWPWFMNPRRVNEPRLFRLRSLRHFLLARNPRRK